MKINFKKILVVLVVLGVVGLIGSQLVFGGGQNKKIESAVVKRTTLIERLTISGEIDAKEKATLRFQTSGLLSWVGVKEGDWVKKFQGVASLDQRSVRKTLGKYLTAYQKDRNAFDNDADTYKDKVMTDAIKRTINDSQMDLNSAVLDVELQDLTLRFSSLWTPIEGLVTHAESPLAGVNVTPAQAEFEVINPNSIEFLANADQTEITMLKEGQTGELVLDAFPEEKLNGVISNIGFVPKSGETGTVYAVKFDFKPDNSGYRYRMGMTGDLTFVLQEKKNVLSIPQKFVKTSNGEKQVTMERNGKTGKVKVSLGLEADGNVEIVSGLAEGEKVLDN